MSTQRVAILGATGRLGRLLVDTALERGYEVRALARDPKKLQRFNERLTVIQGDAQTGQGLDALLSGCRFAVSALASVRPVLEDCAKQLVTPLSRQVKPKFERLVFISAMGAGDSHAQATAASGPLRPLLPTLLKPLYDDLERAERVIRKSGLPYVLVRTAALTNAPPEHKLAVVTSDDAPPGRVPRADVAPFIIKLLETPGWDGREVSLGSE